MRISSLFFQSFRYYWKNHLGLLFGAFLASAILSGSLVVGDSVRGSLQKAAAERLGNVQSGVLGGDRWFTEALAKKSGAAPLILMNGSVSAVSGQARVNAVQVLGIDESFWKLSPSGKTISGFALNETLANRLDVKVGDTVLVRLELPSAISRDAPLSGNTNQEVTLRRKIETLVKSEDFGSFQLIAAQTATETVFVPLAELQSELEKQGKANAMLSAKNLTDLEFFKPRQTSSAEKDKACEVAVTHAAQSRLSNVLVKPSLEDFALKVTKLAVENGAWELGTDRVFLDGIIAEKILSNVKNSFGVLTYLVNGLSSAKGRTPYSMVTAAPFVDELLGEAHKENGAVITQWLADDQKLAIGDKLEIRYFTVGLGREMQEQTSTFTVGAILPMNDPRVNRSWTPNFPGVSDVDNCRDWEPGIPVKLDAIRDQDEKYWDDYRGTPKAFIRLEDGQKLWANRFGDLTSIRFASENDESKLKASLVDQLRLSDIGLVPRDFKAEGSAAAKGSVDFGGLFVGLSLFLIAAALVFSGLLFVFTLEKRAPQIGLLLAIGWSVKNVRRTVLGEAGLVAIVGAGLGLLGGVIYTKLALAGLNGAWSGATVGLTLIYSAKPATLIMAFTTSALTAFLTLWLASRRMFKLAPKDLLVGEIGSAGASQTSSKRGVLKSLLGGVPYLLVVLALVLPVLGSRASKPEAMAGMFFGSGFCLLAAGLWLGSRWLRAQSRSTRLATSLGQIGARNITRRPSRSLAVIGMMAGGIFLVIAVNAFRLSAGSDSSERASGTGGFALIGESSLPVYEDLNTEAAWDVFALDEKLMAQVKVVPFRVREGDDASCLNLNRAQLPMLTAVRSPLLAERKAFAFASGDWGKLQTSSENAPIPAIADQATALWGLGKGVGDTLTYTDASGKEFQVQLVALVAGSVLQGKIIINESDFLKRYPDAAGYKFFLIDAEKSLQSEISAHLTKQLQTRGLALETTSARLNAFNAVQNTYIGIFTILGGLGVLLGTAGLGVLAMRNVLERKGEFGVMQAIGFRRSALQKMVLSEHVALLLGGLILGLISAAIAVWPNVQQSGGVLPVEFLLSLNVGILVFGIAICWFAAIVALNGKLLDAVRKE